MAKSQPGKSKSGIFKPKSYPGKQTYSQFKRYKAPQTAEAFSLQNSGRTWKPSEQQEAIFKAVDSDSSVVVEAGAGCGKTTTQIEAVKPLATKNKICLLAFNKAIATELQSKVPSTIEAKTIHALGLQCCNANVVGRVKIDNKREKVDYAIEELVPLDQFPKLSNETSVGHRGRYYAFTTTMRKLVSYSKNYGYRNVTLDQLGDMAATYDVSVPIDEYITQTVNTILDMSFNDVNTVDFDDMIWMPIVQGWKLPKYDLVGVDEAQDLNPLRQQFVNAVANRSVVIGDSRQAIYGFCGADTKSMATMRNMLAARGKVIELPLNITRRCPKSHVALANQIYADALQAAPEAPEGTVGKSQLADLKNNLQARDFVLSRTNAPLIWLALQLIKNSRPVVILGRDFCEGLKLIIRQCGGNTQAEFLTNLQRWYGEQCARFEGDHPRVVRIRETIEDKYNSLVAVCGECSSSHNAIARLDELFGEQTLPNAVTLSSIHKAKGLEAERVFVTHPHLLPHPMAKMDWEVVQEGNLRYVSYTRSKSHLEIVEGDYRELRKGGLNGW
jgi:hypothetical protein